VLPGLLAYISVNENGSTIFDWLIRITTVTILITWDIILIAYMGFYQGLAYHGINQDSFAYKAPCQPYTSYFVIFFFTIIIVSNGFQVFLSESWNVKKFVTAYIGLPIFLVFSFSWKVFKCPVFVRVQDMDFTTGRRQLTMSKLHNYSIKFITNF